MENYVTSDITGKTYRTKDVVRLINLKQILYYWLNNIEMLDLYPSFNKDGEPVLVAIVSREGSRWAYDLWCKRQLTVEAPSESEVSNGSEVSNEQN